MEGHVHIEEGGMARSSRTPSRAWLCIALTLSIALVTAGCGTASTPSRVAASTATPAATAPRASTAPSATPGSLSMATAPATVEPCPEPPPAEMDPAPGPDARIPEPATLQRMETFSTDFPQKLAVADGSIWTANEFLDTVTRVDATTAKVTSIRVPVGLGPQGIAEAADAIWAAGAGGLVRIDPRSNAVDPRVVGC